MAEGRHAVIAVAVGKGGSQAIGLGPAPGDKGKLTKWDRLRKTLREKEAIGVVIIGEAWVVKAKPEEVVPQHGGGSGKARAISQFALSHPDRREALTIQWEFLTEDAGKIVGSWSRPFSRSEGKVSFDEKGEASEPAPGGMTDNLLEKHDDQGADKEPLSGPA